MNMFQIAQFMGDTMTFGELPEYALIITRINAVVAEEDHQITPETSGTAFRELYNGLTHQQKNTLSTIFDDNLKLRSDVLTDVMLHNSSKDRMANDIQKNKQLTLMVLGLLMMVSALYCGYSYHQEATKILGDQYQSSLLSSLNIVGQIWDAVTGEAPPNPQQ